MSNRELLKQALDVLNDNAHDEHTGDCNGCGHHYGTGHHHPQCEVGNAITAIRTALAQPAIDGFGGNLDAAFDAPAPEPVVPADMVMVPREPTEAMVKAYLLGNAKYWEDSDKQPTPPDRWRGGTPAQATAAGYRAMIAAAPGSAPAVPDPAMGNPISPMKPLTDDQLDAIVARTDHGSAIQDFARAIEAHHGIGTQGGGK